MVPSRSVTNWVVVVAVGSLAASALGVPTLLEIPPYSGVGWGAGSTFAGYTTEGRSVSPDGMYVVGLCKGTNTTSAGVSSANQVGFIWDKTNASKWVILGGHGASIATGITYRYESIAGQHQVVVHGLSSGFPCTWFSYNPYDPINPTFQWDVRDTTISGAPQVATGGTVSSLDVDDIVYTIWDREISNTDMLFTDKLANQPPACVISRDKKNVDAKYEAGVLGVSGVGLSVGRRKLTLPDDTVGPYGNYFLQYKGNGTSCTGSIDSSGLGTQFNGWLPGLDGTNAGEAWAVSRDGTKVFGVSPVLGGRTGVWPYMMVVVPNTDPLTGGIPTQTAIYELPAYPDTAGSASNARPYGCSADGAWACGMNYRGTERAVLWDLRDAEPANWKVYDVTSYLAAGGNLGPFSRLHRAYSVAANDNEVVVSGIGVVSRVDVAPFKVGIGDIFILTVGTAPNQTTISYAAAAASVADVTAGLAAAWNASTSPLCTPFTATASPTFLTLTPDVPGTPFPLIVPSTDDEDGSNDQSLVISQTSGWTLTIPLADFPLPETGACCVIGSCNNDKFAADCPDISGQQRWTANYLCANAGCPGACCDPMTGACSDFVESATCTDGGGLPRSASSVCAAGTCLGSCCKTDGTCEEEPPDYCTSIDGQKGALGSVCEASTCLGACCVAPGQCELMNFGACPDLKFKGIGTICEEGITCPCSVPFADADGDGDVDQDDFAVFQTCFTGDLASPPALTGQCDCLDRVTDDKITGDDYAEFEKCATGPGITWTGAQTPLCVPGDGSLP